MWVQVALLRADLGKARAKRERQKGGHEPAGQPVSQVRRRGELQLVSGANTQMVGSPYFLDALKILSGGRGHGNINTSMVKGA